MNELFRRVIMIFGMTAESAGEGLWGWWWWWLDIPVRFMILLRVLGEASCKGSDWYCERKF